MMLRKPIKYLLLLLIGTILGSCSTRSGLGAVNLSHVYQKNGVLVRPKIRIFNENKFESTIHFSFSSEEMLYIRSPQTGLYNAHVDVEVFMYETFQRELLVDTASLTIKDAVQELSTNEIRGALTVDVGTSLPRDTYILLIRFHDRNRKLYFDEVRILERTDPYSDQNFLVVDTDSNIVFGHHIQLGEQYRMINNDEVGEFKVTYYDREFGIATPPFVKTDPTTFDYRADSVFELQNGAIFSMDRPGFYHFQIDDETRMGYTLFHYYPTFPLVTDKSHLQGPMRYLTSNLEYEGMDVNSADTGKIELDKFWIRHAGTVERAKDQIEEYYSRVEAANIFFTSYQEGWRTDRGILYVVYGPPTNIYRSRDTETWVYGEEASSLNYTFVFDKMINPFSNNDYSLRRKSEYRYGWGLALESWRHGRIYDAEDIKRAQDERDQQLRQTAPPYLWY